MVELMSGLSRHELAHTIFEHLGWRASSGEDSTCSALGLLETLEREGLLHLPAKDESRIRGARKAPARTAAGEPGERIECDLSELGEVVLEPIHDPDQFRLFNELVDRYHDFRKLG